MKKQIVRGNNLFYQIVFCCAASYSPRSDCWLKGLVLVHSEEDGPI